MPQSTTDNTAQQSQNEGLFQVLGRYFQGWSDTGSQDMESAETVYSDELDGLIETHR